MQHSLNRKTDIIPAADAPTLAEKLGFITDGRVINPMHRSHAIDTGITALQHRDTGRVLAVRIND